MMTVSPERRRAWTAADGETSRRRRSNSSIPSMPSATKRAATFAKVSSSAGFVTSVGGMNPPRRVSMRPEVADSPTGAAKSHSRLTVEDARRDHFGGHLISSPLDRPATPGPIGPRSGDAVTSRTLTLGASTYPLVLPNSRDPRLHVAAVIITIHVLGQTVLGFRVSIPQILAAILTCAVIEIALTFRGSRAIVWPASAMLTGSGVALILRVVGTPPDQPWSTYGWYIFAAVAGLSLLSKYVIKYRGSHVFNPSNLGLVVAFIVLGSSRIEPLDFWWGPLSPQMLLAYAVIVGGGLLITRRLKLLVLAASFWLVLAAGLGVLAASGHCMTANWAFAPVCGFDYWRVIVTSPETMIFLFFMITDPKTVPGGRVGRVAFGALVAVASVVMMATQSDEFGTKVALLAGLVVLCVAKPLIDRFAPLANSTADRVGYFARRAVL